MFSEVARVQSFLWLSNIPLYICVCVMSMTWVQSLYWADLSEKVMSTHFSILAWLIPWTEEPGGLQSMGLQSQIQLTNNMFTFIHTHTHTYMYETFIFCIHSSAEGDFSCFYTLTMVNNAAIHTAVHISFQISIFALLGYIPRSEISVLYIVVLCLTFQRNFYCLP